MPRKKTQEAVSVRDAGRKGGETTSMKYGKDFYEAIGAKGGQSTKKKHGPQFYSEIGRQGGKSSRGNKK